MFMHVPGIKVVMPATAYDAKGLLIAAVRDGNPVLYIDDRWLYDELDEAPEQMYEVRIGSAAVRRRGSDLSIVATSYMASQAVKAARILELQSIDAEVIDLRSISPWDQETVLASVQKTGCLLVADAAWKTCGVAAEIAASVTEEAFDYLQAPVIRICLPDVPAPTSGALEEVYYPRADDIVAAAKKLIAVKEKKWVTGSRS
jgi:pyruvate dehydrogenase E1 component beta subunit